MDAERMLNELIGNASVAGYLTASDQSPNENFRKVYALRIQLLPLIRSGLALQRLEQLPDIDRFEVADSPTYGDWLASLAFTNRSGVKSRGPTIPAAITAALDAAGVEK